MKNSMSTQKCPHTKTQHITACLSTAVFDCWSTYTNCINKLFKPFYEGFCFLFFGYHRYLHKRVQPGGFLCAFVGQSCSSLVPGLVLAFDVLNRAKQTLIHQALPEEYRSWAARTSAMYDQRTRRSAFWCSKATYRHGKRKSLAPGPRTLYPRLKVCSFASCSSPYTFV